MNILILFIIKGFFESCTHTNGCRACNENDNRCLVVDWRDNYYLSNYSVYRSSIINMNVMKENGTAEFCHNSYYLNGSTCSPNIGNTSWVYYP